MLSDIITIITVSFKLHLK